MIVAAVGVPTHPVMAVNNVIGIPTLNKDALRLPDIRNGDWHHVVMVCDPARSARYFYINGTLISAAENVPYVPVIPQGQFHLGIGLESCKEGICAADGWGFAGSVDELRIYNRTLDIEEIQATVWGPKLSSKVAASLVLHWGFNDPIGQVERDLSGNENHGLRGSLAGYQNSHFPVLFDDGKSSFSEISSPKFVQSTASRLGASSSVVLARPSVPVRVYHVDCNAPCDEALLIDQAPRLGELRLVILESNSSISLLPTLAKGDGRAMMTASLSYFPPAAWPNGLTFPITFTLRVGQGASSPALLHTVSLYPAPLCVPEGYKIPGKVVLGEYRLLNLGGICADGQRPSSEVLRPPTFGKLYQVADGISVRDNKKYIDFSKNAKQQGLIGAELSEFPIAVAHPQGPHLSAPLASHRL